MTFDHSVPLTDSLDIPLVGFGTYLIEDTDADAAVSAAVEAGYRHIDTAQAYGNEAGVGRGLRTGMARSGLARDDVFVTAKVWPGNPEWGEDPLGPDDVFAALDGSLKRLGLDHVDLYLIHAPYGGDRRLAQWAAMIELRDQGRARAIGVSNYERTHLAEIADAGLETPAADQVELHPWSQKPELVATLRAKGIRPIAYSSLVPLSTWRSAPGHDSAKPDSLREDGARPDAPLRLLAQKYSVTEPQLLLRWGVQQGYPVLPKTTNAERLRLNLDLFGFTIDEADMAEISRMDRGGGLAWATGDPVTAA